MMLHLSMIIVLAATAGVFEFGLLEKILEHPAGEPPAANALLVLSCGAALPLAASVVVALFAKRGSTLHKGVSVPLVVACVLGPLFALIALRQYGHSTPGVLVIGYALQLLFVLRAAIRTYRHAA